MAAYLVPEGFGTGANAGTGARASWTGRSSSKGLVAPRVAIAELGGLVVEASQQALLDVLVSQAPRKTSFRSQ